MYITIDVVFHEDSMYFSSESELQGEYHKEIQTLEYDYHISEENEFGQSELVNQEAGELDMSDSSLVVAVAMAPFDSRFDSPATTPFDSCPLSVSADSCPAGAP